MGGSRESTRSSKRESKQICKATWVKRNRSDLKKTRRVTSHCCIEEVIVHLTDKLVFFVPKAFFDDKYLIKID